MRVVRLASDQLAPRPVILGTGLVGLAISRALAAWLMGREKAG